MKAIPFILLYAGIFSLSIAPVNGQKSITSAGSTDTQNFNSLPSSGTELPATGGIFAEGWSFLESGTSKNEQFQAGSGTSTTGDTYSLGNLASADRAFGMLQTGSLGSILGFTFQNNTGQVISSLTVGYTGEVWRLSAAPDGLAFSYQVGDRPLDESTGWIVVPALQFTTPVTGAGAVDGNTAANRSVLNPFTLTGLSLLPGEFVTFRWVDASGTNSAAMGIDDFTLRLHPAFTGYFRSRTSGPWSEPTTWESSTNGSTWSTATTVVPNGQAAGTTVLAGHTISVTSHLVAGRLTVQPGGKLRWTAGTFTLSDAPGDDLILEGANSDWELAANTIPVLAGSASVRIGPGAILNLSGHNNLLAFHGHAYTYADAAVFEYSHTTAPLITGTFFSSGEEGDIPVFRYNSPVATALGASGATTINGAVEVANGRTFNLNGVSGPLLIRNGITGNGNLSSSTTIQFTGARAILGGTGTLNSHLSIQPGCTTMVDAEKVIAGSRTLTVNGVLDFGTGQLRTAAGTASLTVSGTGTLHTASPGGLLSVNGSLRSGSFSVSFAPGSTVVYKATGNQDLSIANLPAYQNLVVSGTGTKTVQSGGNLVVQGTCQVESGATLALFGNAGEDLYLNNHATLEVLTGGSFDNGGESSITFSGGTPAIRIAGTFITRDRQGFVGTGTVIPTIVPQLLTGSTIDYGRPGDQTIQATPTYENLTCSGSGVKTPTNAVAVNRTLSIRGSAVLDGNAHTIGGLTTQLVMMENSRLVVGGTGTQPPVGGTYTLSPGTTIEFANNNLTTATIRQGGPVIQYANIEIMGSNIAAPLSGITLQSGAAFRIKEMGVLKLAAVNGLYAASNAAVLTTNGSVIDLQPGSTVEYNGAAQVITTGIAYSKLTLSGSGNKTALAAPVINQRLTRSGSAELAGQSPVYAPGASLVYTDGGAGRTYTQGLEWPEAGPQMITVNLPGAGSPAVRLSGNRLLTGDLTLQAGALSLEGFSLVVDGNLKGNGTLTGSPASTLALNSGSSHVSFTQLSDGTTNALETLLIKGGTVTLGNRLHLYKLLDVGGGTLDLADQSLVLKSGPAQTARVAERKGVLLGATRVTVERFVNGAFQRRWRLLTAPVGATTLNAAWQEGRTWNGAVPDNLSPGYGTLITGQQQGTAAAANAKGFDFWPGIAGGQASIRRYQGSNHFTAASWQPLDSTTAAGFTAGEAYLLFVRGDRSATSGGGGTVLRATGALKENAAYTININPSQSHTVVGNPFASPLNFRKLYEENMTTIKPYYWIWQAGLSSAGGYALVKPEWEGSTTYEVIPYGGGSFAAEPVISSGEGFFVVPAESPSASTLTIKQAHKSAQSSTTTVLRQSGQAPAKLYINLYATGNNTASLLDGILLQFGKTGETEKPDLIAKPLNSAENLSIYQSGRDWLLAESSLPLPGNETQLRLWNTTERAYKLQVQSRDFTWPGGTILLWDRYLDKKLPVALGDEATTYPFTVTGDGASRDPLRFKIIYEGQHHIPLPLQLLSFRLVDKEPGVGLEWKIEGEKGVVSYAVERSAHGQLFQTLATVPAKGVSGSIVYEWTDRQPLEKALYRLKMLYLDGVIDYSPVINYEKKADRDEVVVFPNPVKDNKLYIHVNAGQKGTYTLTLYNNEGAQQWRQQRLHGGGDAVWSLNISPMLPAAGYMLVIKPPLKKSKSLQVQVVR